MISEKDKKIVVAVFASRGELGGIADRGDNVLECLSSTGAQNQKGSYTAGSRQCNSAYWQVICTIEEYNQCIEDMARAGWMSGGIGCSYSLYKSRLQLKGIDTSNKELLKENCDYSFYDKPLVYTQEMEDSQDLPLVGMEFMFKFGHEGVDALSKVYGVGFTQDGEWFVFHNDVNDVFLQNISNGVYTFHPIKTPEQIKQDKLNEHIKKIADSYDTRILDQTNGLTSLIQLMYIDGYIVEPK